MVNSLPARFADVADLEHGITRRGVARRAELAAVPEVLVLGVGGKMGPTLARMAKRAGKRVIGVARFSEPGLREKLERWGIE
jgi:NADPH:quinone reductase-like Zn-dependent oxidoreductase